MRKVKNHIQGRLPYFWDRDEVIRISQISVVTQSQQVGSRSMVYLQDHSQISQPTRLKTLMRQLEQFARIGLS